MPELHASAIAAVPTLFCRIKKCIYLLFTTQITNDWSWILYQKLLSEFAQEVKAVGYLPQHEAAENTAGHRWTCGFHLELFQKLWVKKEFRSLSSVKKINKSKCNNSQLQVKFAHLADFYTIIISKYIKTESASMLLDV